MTHNGNLLVSEQDVARLSRLMGSLVQRLRAQREVLRQRGMDVPPGTIKTLENLYNDLEAFGARLAEQNNELDRLRALADTTALISSSLDLDTTLSTVMDTVLKLTGAQRGYIMLRNAETGEMEFRVARGIAQTELNSESLVVSKTIVEKVLEDGAPIVTTNAQMDDRFAGQQSIIGYNLRSILCVPLIIKGEIEGVVYADNSIKDGLFGKKELQLLAAVASQSALAIENAQLFEQARATLEEITEIKTLLDNILASIASGVITTDADNRVTTYNVGAENILGIPRNAIYGQPLAQAVPVIYNEVKDVLPTVRSYDEVVTLETEAVMGGSDVRSLNLRLSPLKDASAATQGIALVLDDLTDFKKRDAMLQAVRRYLPPAMVDNIRSIEGIGLGGERRTVTVLFAEVRPFDSFPPHLKAGELMEMLNIYLTVGTEAVHRRAGLIDKYMGSEIMGLFNTQLNPSDHHAADAVQAALEMIEDFHALYARLGENPKTPYYRIGIHTGVATLGNVGSKNRREFSALGDTVNLAKRLQENAQYGQLIISRATFDTCQDYLRELQGVEIIARDALQVKGRSQITQIFELRPTV